MQCEAQITNKYYVYGLVDPTDNTIKYVGKGCGYRMFRHVKDVKNNKSYDNNFTKFNGISKILQKGYEDIAYSKLYETNDEELAYTKEEEFILKYQTLVTEGGWNLRESARPPKRTGCRLSEEHKQKISNALKGRIKTVEHLKNISTALKGKQICLGRVCSEETKKRIRESNASKTQFKKDQTPWNKGKIYHIGPCNDETKLKISLANKEAWKKRKLKSKENENQTNF